MALIRVWYPRCWRNHSSRSRSSRMVTTAFRRGHTTVAFFQNSSLVARASGSDSIPSRISASLMRRSLFQSVPVPRLEFDVLPVVAPFMRFRAPCRDDSSFAILSVRVNYRNLQAIHKTDGVHPDLAIVEAVIDPFNSRPLENPLRILERNSVQCDIAAVFLSVPTIAHRVYL